MYIKDRNSDVYLQYKPNNDYQVVIEKYNSTSLYQRWYIIPCCSDGFPEYYYIANSTATDWWKRVIAADSVSGSPLFLEPMSTSGINLS